MKDFDKDKFLEHLKNTWGEGRLCPMCGDANWIITPGVFTLISSGKPNTLVIGGPQLPLVPVTCKKCGNTIFISALVSKIVPQPEDSAEQSAQPRNANE